MAYTKEQRAAKAVQSAPEESKFIDSNGEKHTMPKIEKATVSETVKSAVAVMMIKDGVETLVNNNDSVHIMEGLGWTRA